MTINEIITAKFSIDAGVLVRGSVKSEMKIAAFNRDLSIECEEDKGFLNSIYYFKIHGNKENVDDFMEWLNAWKHYNAF